MQRRFDTAAAIPLADEVDLQDVLRNVGDDYHRKGLLFLRHVRALGDEFRAVRETLEAPPSRFYVPFTDYPTRDYFRIFDVVARRNHKAVSSGEAWRRQARAEIGSIVEIPLGRLTWHLFDSPMQVFEKYAQLSRMVATRPIAESMAMGDRRIRVTYREPIGSMHYGLGICEGIVLGFRLHPRITVTVDEAETSYDVRWDV